MSYRHLRDVTSTPFILQQIYKVVPAEVMCALQLEMWLILDLSDVVYDKMMVEYVKALIQVCLL